MRLVLLPSCAIALWVGYREPVAGCFELFVVARGAAGPLERGVALAANRSYFDARRDEDGVGTRLAANARAAFDPSCTNVLPVRLVDPVTDEVYSRADEWIRRQCLVRGGSRSSCAVLAHPDFYRRDWPFAAFLSSEDLERAAREVDVTVAQLDGMLVRKVRYGRA